MPKTIYFSAPAEVETPNWRTTWGHRAAIASRVRQAVRNSVPAKPEYPRYFIGITRVGMNLLDDDNLVAACKAARDEIAAWLELDDADPRLTWSYFQRREVIRDESPRPKRKHRTWLEFAVSDEPFPLELTPRPAPPDRLEREKPRPDVRVDAMRPPLRSIEVGSGVRVELAEAPDGRTYVRICKHYVQQGHAWRTSGVVIELEHVDNLKKALDELTK